MRIDAITIRAFRGFNREIRLIFGDANIISGPNGYGKSSLFDGILWCLFGSVPRLSGTRDFTKAGDVYQNKFTSEAYSVALELSDGDGSVYARRRGPNFVVSEVNGKRTSDANFLGLLGLDGSNGQDRFLRYFFLQQETINGFLKELNPRGRYDAMVSLLEFKLPERLSARLHQIGEAVGIDSRVATNDRSVAESNISALERQVEELTRARTDLSIEVVSRQYNSLLVESQAVRKIVGFEDSATDDRLPARLPEFISVLSTWAQQARRLESELNSLQTLHREASYHDANLDQRSVELQNETANLRASIGSTQANISKITDRLRELNDGILNIRSSNDRLQALLADLRQYVSEDICPVCRRPIDRQVLIGILDTELNKSPQVEHLVSERQNLERELREAEATRQILAVDLQKRSSEAGQVDRVLQARKRFDASWSELRRSPLLVAFAPGEQELDGAHTRIRTIILELEALQQRGLELSQLIERLNATRLLPQRLAELGSTKKSVEKSLQQSKALDAVSYTIRKCSSAVASTRTMLVSRLLELHKPLIRSLYRRLQPHPVFTDIDFEIQEAYKEAELYFKVFSEDGAVSAYPSTIFSASQLNALAVCIFLALSLHSLGPLSLMILDDPIQSMDDINVLGLCDVIRQLKDNRQLFISTHNEDFYRLLLNKLRPLSSDSRVRGIRFESWSREGPQLKDEEVEFTDLRIDVNRMASLIGSPAA